jgi:hypothetical protein
MILNSQETIAYVSQYGGRCRDCADESVCPNCDGGGCSSCLPKADSDRRKWRALGICPISGLPCSNKKKAIKWVIDAINYGVEHGYLSVSAEAAIKRQQNINPNVAALSRAASENEFAVSIDSPNKKLG